ncbi:MAG: AraC family transcriptional regulator [Sphaerochaeta sp.]|jgi:YesN/AraC family two-component response regulator|uniref:helix-turn-helix domain-containing protein n=1 Tax=Sphaerochaeta sp. TaxID=1972642 RepID=UPI000AA94B80|nr:AraC family transcriptional regulator [Sphaerochaeta sp.]MCK9602709.1 AraC family transcriptional regulator [Sphaerochaeta sp.]MDX9824458.1 AraC family transcriptional regulator [Sphaerochaeta sp.]HPE92372.1 AraC family transcriptional regulator [Sphaerochaeta sp.]
MKYEKLDLLFNETLVIKVNHADDPVFYVFDYQKRHLNMEFQHFHTYYEVYVLIDDAATHIIEGEYFSLQRGDIVLLKPMCLHKSLYPEHENPKSRLIIAFQFPLPSGFERQTERLLSLFDEKVPIYRFEPAILQSIIKLFNEIYLMGTSSIPGSDLMIHHTFQKILWIIATNRKANRYAKQEIVDSITQKIYEITSYMHSHFEEDLPLAEIALKFSISPFYLSRQFKEVTGTTYITYLQLVRVRNAQNLLLYSNTSIRDICSRCGFSSFSQFNRVFHKYCNMNPTEFRKDVNHQSQLLLRQSDPERNAHASLPRILQSPEEQEGKRSEMHRQGAKIIERQ